MSNLPRAPKDFKKANELIDKLSHSDLKLLDGMDDYSRKYFFESVQWEINRRREESRNERIRALKFFFIIAGICALVAAFILKEPYGEVSALFWVFSSLFLVSIVGNFISIPVRAIQSAIKKTEFSLRECLLSNNLYVDGVLFVSIFILALNDLF